ncbi:tannase/feruloyl esterase family alpha/beta hydrolase [Pseudomonas sp. RIT-PI-S]|uniref:tannase/feruloyl esterase family alpha/beta hydrolase n=1 Tax=Pseudomonas sp. RIT-PI-S TaxID=3035295 RepID=UPI0021DA377A|nr:tannase/feruloyl esterase family alpha/beta hydrolase [Pseudomonas sp. RIT-PI-S]
MAAAPAEPVAVPEAQVVLPERSCASLAAMDLTAVGGAGSHVLTATLGTENGAPACVVEGRLAPSISFKAVLPTQTWTQRYLQVGCGGLCGRVELRAGAAHGCKPLTDGSFAMASTDMGHQGQDARFGDDPQKRVDFAYRAVHLTALASKQLIETFYGRAPRYAYFNGCSDGGREALMEAQRYPQDFNGIIAGAAALDFQVQNGIYHPWLARANTAADGTAIVLASQLPLIHREVLKQCDALDGATDGLIADPLACHLDLTPLACRPGQNADQCLSAAQLEAVRRFYAGPSDPASGRPLLVGSVLPGSELNWAGVFVPMAAGQPIFSEKIALEALRTVLYPHNPTAAFSLADLRFDQAGFDLLRPMHGLYDATNPDLSAFSGAGGKLILWHGWADPHISPMNTLAYHQALKATLGDARTKGFERLYLLPGVSHCGGGEGPGAIDLLTPLLAWVETRQAPGALLATGASDDAPGFGAPLGPPPGDRPREHGPEVNGPGPEHRPAGPAPRPGRLPGSGNAAPITASRLIQPYDANPSIAPWLGADFFQNPDRTTERR